MEWVSQLLGAIISVMKLKSGKRTLKSENRTLHNIILENTHLTQHDLRERVRMLEAKETPERRAESAIKFIPDGGLLVFGTKGEPLTVRLHDGMTVMKDIGDWLRRNDLYEPLPEEAYGYNPFEEDGESPSEDIT